MTASGGGGGGAWEFREMDELDKKERATTSARSTAAKKFIKKACPRLRETNAGSRNLRPVINRNSIHQATSNAATRRFRVKCLPLLVHRVAIVNSRALSIPISK